MRKLVIASCVLVALLGLLGGVSLRNLISQGAATLDVEALISKGTTFRIYYNNQWSESQTAPVRPGEWTKYRFNVPGRITALRFDPSEQSGAKVYIRRIAISSPAASQNIDIGHLRNWIGADVTVTPDQGSGSMLLSINSPNAYWMGSEDVTLPNRFAFLAQFLLLDADTLLRSLLIAAAVFVLAGIRRKNLRDALVMTGVIIAAIASASLAARYLSTLSGPLPSVNQAVGASVLRGFSLTVELFAANLSIVMALVISALAGFGRKRFRTGTLSPGKFQTEDPAPVNLWLFGLYAGILAAFLFPAAADMLSRAYSHLNLVDSDSQTVHMWEYLVYHGALPWRDFWFPYGGFADRLAPISPYFLYEYVNQLLLMGVLVWTALKVFANRWKVLAGICALYFVLGMANVILLGASDRYLLGLSVVLLCAVAARETDLKYFVAFGLWCAYVVTQEASQLAYAIPASFILLAAAAYGAQSRTERIRFIRAVGAGGLAATGGVLVYFAYLYSRSQLGGWFEFMQSLNAQAAYGAGLTPLAGWFTYRQGLESTFLIALLVLLCGGVLHVACRKVLPSVYSYLPLCIGLLGWVLLQKEITRAGIVTQILPIPLIGLAILLFQLRGQLANPWPEISLSFFLAFIFGFFVLDQRVSDTIQGRLTQTAKLPSHVSAAFFRSAQWSQANEYHFSSPNLQFGDISGPDLRDRLRSLAPLGPDDSMFVLGNNSDLYTLFGKTPPYSFYLYNMSPIDLQQRTVSWLEQKQPRYVFWDMAHRDFDGVPNQIRLPLVFTYIVKHYQAIASFGDYQILRLMNPGDKSDFSYWSRSLGTTIDLGYIPATSSLTGQENAGDQVPALIVDVAQPVNGVQEKIAVELDNQPLTILFRQQEGHKRYLIRLDRLPILATGGDLRIACCATAQIRTVSVPRDDLY